MIYAEMFLFQGFLIMLKNYNYYISIHTQSKIHNIILYIGQKHILKMIFLHKNILFKKQKKYYKIP